MSTSRIDVRPGRGASLRPGVFAIWLLGIEQIPGIFSGDYFLYIFLKTLTCCEQYYIISARVPKDIAVAFKAKCAAESIPQAQIIKKAIEEFLSQ